MRKGSAIALCAGAVSACAAPARQALRATSPAPPDATFTCVLRELAGAEYEIRNTDRDAGVLQAERPLLGATGEALLGQYYLALSVTVLPAAAASEIRAIATKSRAPYGGRSSAGQSLSDRDLTEVRALLGRCGTVAVTPSVG